MSDPVKAGTFDQPISGTLANALAAAANNPNAPTTFYVVARYRPGGPRFPIDPFNVQEPFDNPDDAANRVEELKTRDPDGEYGIFGPFANLIVAPLDQATVEKFEVTTTGPVARSTFPIQGRSFDALFFSVQAVEKFVVPYYSQELGPEYGALILREFQHASLALMGHLPWSEEVLITAPEGNGDANAAEPRRVTRKTYRPALIEPDENGGVRWRRLDPPAPGEV